MKEHAQIILNSVLELKRASLYMRKSTDHFNSVVVVHHVQQRVGFLDVIQRAHILEAEAKDWLRQTQASWLTKSEK